MHQGETLRPAEEKHEGEMKQAFDVWLVQCCSVELDLVGIFKTDS